MDCLLYTSYGAMGLYILVNEFAFRKIAEWEGNVNRSAIFWIVKYIVLDVYKRQGSMCGNDGCRNRDG